MNNFQKEREWIIANRKGSYSSSSISFANLRTYHGVCVKRSEKDFSGKVLLSKLYEDFKIKGNIYSIDTNYYEGGIYPQGYKHLISFEEEPYPQFVYDVAETLIKKSLVMDPEEDWLVIRYEFYGTLPDTFYLHPLFAFRNYHQALRKRDLLLKTEKLEKGYRFIVDKDQLSIFVDGEFVRDSVWYYGFEYPVDKDRGLNYVEDLYHEGYFVIEHPSRKIDVKLSCSDIEPPEFDTVKKRTLKSIFTIKNELDKVLRRSSLFLIKDDIIAGYYWFGPWTRDTMISLPGLLLVTKRYRLAKTILEKYAGFAESGVLPVSLTDPKNRASADSSLWYVYALYKYYEYTKDKKTLEKLFPVSVSIIEAYVKGNELFGLKGSLIETKKPQLTWMDAKTGDIVFTPRTGLPVEVNALWYNALASVNYFSNELNRKVPEYIYELLPKVKEEFLAKFVKNDTILDVAEPDDYSLRPNFILAFSLPYPLLSDFAKYKKVVDDKLLTPFGLRSLSPDDPKYSGRYEGDQFSRDKAYHNGSVWPWLAGPYIKASVRSGADKEQLYEYFKPLIKMDMIPEIFDGDEPHEPKGCVMQAWSYGELLRAYSEDLTKNIQ